MNTPAKIVVFHTAFIGDVVLAVPLLQLLRERFPEARIAAVTTPETAEVLSNHPAVDRVIIYDKRGVRAGIPGIVRMAGELRSEAFDTAVIPHRSLRSALVCRLAGIPVRVGFDTSMGRFLLTHKERYVPTDHEILRNLALSRPLGVPRSGMRLPKLYPSSADKLEVDTFLREQWGEGALQRPPLMVGIAPGSVWNTKRWPEQKFADLIQMLARDQWSVVLIGGKGDTELCARLRGGSKDARVVDASGRLSLLQSADLISRCAVIVTNDSAPMHLALAMRVPIVALFGPTVPEFGFAPVGRDDRIVETNGLRCRPCAIHGGKKCPVGTFDCMEMILPVRVRNEVHAMVHRVS